jgi:N utilization substance protein A
LKAKIQDYEKSLIFQKYKEKVGEIIIGEVYQVWNKEMLILDEEKIELVLPKTEQIPADHYRKGDTIRAVVLKVELKNNNPVIVLSRTSPIFLERLLESEVPEIYDGLITIKNIVRAPGERSKVAVESYDDRIDPVGSCVGMKGGRIHGIVRELRNENIDVINYTTNTELYIQRALNPAKVSSVKVLVDEKRAEVFMKPEEVSLAIGKGGHNIKLASKITGFEIDVYRDTDEDFDDVDIREFSDEIDQWVIDELIKIGCDSAKSVLALSPEELLKRTELEEETISSVLSILKAEFEE